MKNKFILNADDFGLTKYHNEAVLEGYNSGLLTSASLIANGDSFFEALEIIKKCPNLGLSAHLNIMEGKPLTDCSYLISKEGFFNKGYLYLILNQNNKTLLNQIELEFRNQIEKILNYTKIDHLDSHVHTHAIPEIFKLTSKLAKEYNIKYIRTQKEIPYIIPNSKIGLNYLINRIKVILLSYYTKKNQKTLKKYNLKSNDYIIGVGYTGMMNNKAIKYGIKKIKDSAILETLIHPCKYDYYKNDYHSLEYEILKDKDLKETIQNLGFEFTNYKNLLV